MNILSLLWLPFVFSVNFSTKFAIVFLLVEMLVRFSIFTLFSTIFLQFSIQPQFAESKRWKPDKHWKDHPKFETKDENQAQQFDYPLEGGIGLPGLSIDYFATEAPPALCIEENGVCSEIFHVSPKKSNIKGTITLTKPIDGQCICWAVKIPEGKLL